MLCEIKLNFSEMRLLRYILGQDYWLDKIINIRGLFHFEKAVTIMLFDSLNSIEHYIKNQIPSWVIGASYRNTILMLEQNKGDEVIEYNFCQILIHEFVHIAIKSRSLSDCPLWLNEGLACYFAEQCTSINARNLKVNIYDISYTEYGFYNLCSHAVIKLIELYGIELIARKLETVKRLENDEFLGYYNIQKLLSFEAGD